MIDLCMKHTIGQKEKIETREKGFISYMTNTLNRIGMANIWIEQLAHGNNNQLKKPTINKKYPETISLHFYAHYLNIQNNNTKNFKKWPMSSQNRAKK